jgi:hypothetical protein
VDAHVALLHGLIARRLVVRGGGLLLLLVVDELLLALSAGLLVVGLDV